MGFLGGKGMVIMVLSLFATLLEGGLVQGFPVFLCCIFLRIGCVHSRWTVRILWKIVLIRDWWIIGLVWGIKK
jgi:predicted Abi (CAAX) family protease